MPRSTTRSVGVSVLAAVVMAAGGCSDGDDSSDGDLAAWCSVVERAATLLAEVDVEAAAAGDPEAIEAAARAEEAGVELRESDPPAEIRETFERALDPRGFQVSAPPEYAEARDEFGEYVLDNCDIPPEVQEQLLSTTN